MKLTAFVFCACAALPLAAADEKKAAEPIARIQEAAKVFDEIMNIPEKGVPQDLLDNAKCVAIIPGMKRAGFIVGGKYGKGVITCRSMTGGRWSAPSTVRVEGGSIGAQIGAGETDVVMFVMNEAGVKSLMKSDFTIGGEAAAMAGPVGRSSQASTDAFLQAGILTYSRSRGLFAGIDLNGATLREDKEDNAVIYGKPVTHEQLLTGKIAMPASARTLTAALPRMTGPAGSVKKKTATGQ